MGAVNQKITDDYAMYNGDCVDLVKKVPDASIGLSVFSPPFPGMYAYNDSARDMGNAKNTDELIEHYEYLVPELLRVMMPGRNCFIHLTQEPIFKWQEGFTGLRDFRGEMIRCMQKHGWIFASERMIDKDPQLKAARTHDVGLQMKTAATDSSKLTGTMADYLLQFRAPGENTKPVRGLIDHPTTPKLRNKDGAFTAEEWIWWASCCWWNSNRHTPDGGISETKVINNYREGRDEDDEKHLCPLQLQVIERCVKIWSGPGEAVLSPFAGVGSEGFVAVSLNRRFVGMELKTSYYNVAVKNLERAVRTRARKKSEGFGLVK